jgi:hypothetical protein
MLSKLDVPNLGFDRQPFEFQISQRGFGKGLDDIAAAHRPLEAVEFLRSDDDRSVFAVQCDALWSGALRLSDNLAQVSLRILKAPSAGL